MSEFIIRLKRIFENPGGGGWQSPFAEWGRCLSAFTSIQVENPPAAPVDPLSHFQETIDGKVLLLTMFFSSLDYKWKLGFCLFVIMGRGCQGQCRRGAKLRGKS